jgi:hypothetical protein
MLEHEQRDDVAVRGEVTGGVEAVVERWRARASGAERSIKEARKIRIVPEVPNGTEVAGQVPAAPALVEGNAMTHGELTHAARVAPGTPSN